MRLARMLVHAVLIEQQRGSDDVFRYRCIEPTRTGIGPACRCCKWLS